MDSIKLIVLLMLASGLLITSVVYSRANDAKNDETAENGENGGDCSLWVPEKDAPKMPVPYTTNGRRHSIIYPDAKGRLNVGRGRGFRLSCAAGKFRSADLGDAGDALVSCAGGDRLRYRGRVYAYEDFRCDATPKSQLMVTDETCQPENYTVAAVGFQTGARFLRLYHVCFDKSTKNAVYSWYDARRPYHDNHQVDGKRPPFAKTKELYGKTDVNRKYTVNEQRKTVAKILKSDELADKYIKNDSKHSLSRGHYSAKADFFFAYEQSATFYYANVAPQWQLFNGDLWAMVEDKTRRRLARDTGNGTARRRVIVTGTYGSCTLPDADGVQQPLFLDPPRDIPVPLFFWKLDYDLDAGDGLVYVGLNDPYREIDDSAYLCPDVCPDGIDKDDENDDDKDGDKGDNDDKGDKGDKDDSREKDGVGANDGDDDAPVTNKGLVYCCTMESFERAYGRLDPTVFDERDDD